MRWDYSVLSLVMWGGLILYLAIGALLFVLISKGRKKNMTFSVLASLVTLVHVVLLLCLGFSENAAGTRKIGFEAWVCGRQIGIDQRVGLRRLVQNNGKSFFSENKLNIPGGKNEVGVLDRLKEAGLSLDVSGGSLALPVSKEFELRAKAGNAPAWLSAAVDYSGENGSAKLKVADGKVDCPYSGTGEWNVFVARVDNKGKKYTWEKVELRQLSALKLNSSDGDDLPDCMILDYGESKMTAEYRCGYLLKNDSERCASVNKSKCEYREVGV